MRTGPYRNRRNASATRTGHGEDDCNCSGATTTHLRMRDASHGSKSNCADAGVREVSRTAEVLQFDGAEPSSRVPEPRASGRENVDWRGES